MVYRSYDMSVENTCTENKDDKINIPLVRLGEGDLFLIITY